MRKWILLIVFSLPVFSEQVLIVDPHYSPYMGAYDLLSAEWGLTKLEDYLNPNQDEGGTLNIMGRGLEQLGWYTINSVTSTVQHEVFGHGYRLRELGVTPKKYTISLDGGGATYFNVDSSFLVGEMLAVDVAGLEAESILAQTAKMNWLSKGSIDGRLAMTYFNAQQSLFFYTLITHLGRLHGNHYIPGNDIDAYLELLNATYPNSKMTIGELTFWSAFNWLDPMTCYSLFSWFYYIAEGRAWDIPSFKLSENLRYLPNVKIGYAPYGPEAYLENFFSLNSRPIYFYLKGGKRSFGTGLFYDHLIDKDRWSLGCHIDGWIQSQFLSSATLKDFDNGYSVAAPGGKIAGVAFSLINKVRLYSSLKLFLELGGKTAGYLPGYTLSGGIVVRGGVSICDY